MHKRFRRAGPDVLRGVDLVLAPGTVTQVVGGNGSGKSTLLRIVAGLTRPTTGRVRFRPASVAYAPERLPARVRMSAAAYVGQMARIRGVDAAAGARVLERLALSPGPDVAVSTLSKGNRQKVVLAQAFAAPAGLLLLDEPSSGLDDTARSVLGELLGERRDAGAAVLLTTHLPLAGFVPDADLVLHEGELRDAGGDRPDVVRIELVDRRSGEIRTMEATGDESDAVLAAALADGWSVVSVTRDPPRP